MIHSRKQEILLEISSLHCETHTVISSYSQLYCLECNELHIDAALKGNVNSAKSTILTLYSIFQELETTGMTTLSKGEIRKLYMSVFRPFILLLHHQTPELSTYMCSICCQLCKFMDIDSSFFNNSGFGYRFTYDLVNTTLPRSLCFFQYMFILNLVEDVPGLATMMTDRPTYIALLLKSAPLIRNEALIEGQDWRINLIKIIRSLLLSVDGENDHMSKTSLIMLLNWCNKYFDIILDFIKDRSGMIENYHEAVLLFNAFIAKMSDACVDMKTTLDDHRKITNLVSNLTEALTSKAMDATYKIATMSLLSVVLVSSEVTSTVQVVEYALSKLDVFEVSMDCVRSLPLSDGTIKIMCTLFEHVRNVCKNMHLHYKYILEFMVEQALQHAKDSSNFHFEICANYILPQIHAIFNDQQICCAVDILLVNQLRDLSDQCFCSFYDEEGSIVTTDPIRALTWSLSLSAHIKALQCHLEIATVSLEDLVTLGNNWFKQIAYIVDCSDYFELSNHVSAHIYIGMNAVCSTIVEAFAAPKVESKNDSDDANPQFSLQDDHWACIYEIIRSTAFTRKWFQRLWSAPSLQAQKEDLLFARMETLLKVLNMEQILPEAVLQVASIAMMERDAEFLLDNSLAIHGEQNALACTQLIMIVLSRLNLIKLKSNTNVYTQIFRQFPPEHEHRISYLSKKPGVIETEHRKTTNEIILANLHFQVCCGNHMLTDDDALALMLFLENRESIICGMNFDTSWYQYRYSLGLLWSYSGSRVYYSVCTDLSCNLIDQILLQHIPASNITNEEGRGHESFWDWLIKRVNGGLMHLFSNKNLIIRSFNFIYINRALAVAELPQIQHICHGLGQSQAGIHFLIDGILHLPHLLPADITNIFRAELMALKLTSPSVIDRINVNFFFRSIFEILCCNPCIESKTMHTALETIFFLLAESSRNTANMVIENLVKIYEQSRRRLIMNPILREFMASISSAERLYKLNIDKYEMGIAWLTLEIFRFAYAKQSGSKPIDKEDEAVLRSVSKCLTLVDFKRVFTLKQQYCDLMSACLSVLVMFPWNQCQNSFARIDIFQTINTQQLLLGYDCSKMKKLATCVLSKEIKSTMNEANQQKILQNNLVVLFDNFHSSDLDLKIASLSMIIEIRQNIKPSSSLACIYQQCLLTSGRIICTDLFLQGASSPTGSAMNYTSDSNSLQFHMIKLVMLSYAFRQNLASLWYDIVDLVLSIKSRLEQFVCQHGKDKKEKITIYDEWNVSLWLYLLHVIDDRYCLKKCLKQELLHSCTIDSRLGVTLKEDFDDQGNSYVYVGEIDSDGLAAEKYKEEIIVGARLTKVGDTPVQGYPSKKVIKMIRQAEYPVTIEFKHLSEALFSSLLEAINMVSKLVNKTTESNCQEPSEPNNVGAFLCALKGNENQTSSTNTILPALVEQASQIMYTRPSEESIKNDVFEISFENLIWVTVGLFGKLPNVSIDRRFVRTTFKEVVRNLTGKILKVAIKKALPEKLDEMISSSETAQDEKQLPKVCKKSTQKSTQKSMQDFLIEENGRGFAARIIQRSWRKYTRVVRRIPLARRPDQPATELVKSGLFPLQAFRAVPMEGVSSGTPSLLNDDNIVMATCTEDKGKMENSEMKDVEPANVKHLQNVGALESCEEIRVQSLRPSCKRDIPMNYGSTRGCCIMTREFIGSQVNGNRVYCLCRTTNDETPYICCDVCDEWFHPRCAGVPESVIEYIKEFVCPICQLVSFRHPDDNRLATTFTSEVPLEYLRLPEVLVDRHTAIKNAQHAISILERNIYIKLSIPSRKVPEEIDIVAPLHSFQRWDVVFGKYKGETEEVNGYCTATVHSDQNYIDSKIKFHHDNCVTLQKVTELETVSAEFSTKLSTAQERYHNRRFQVNGGIHGLNKSVLLKGIVFVVGLLGSREGPTLKILLRYDTSLKCKYSNKIPQTDSIYNLHFFQRSMQSQLQKQYHFRFIDETWVQSSKQLSTRKKKREAAKSWRSEISPANIVFRGGRRDRKRKRMSTLSS